MHDAASSKPVQATMRSAQDGSGVATGGWQGAADGSKASSRLQERRRVGV